MITHAENNLNSSKIEGTNSKYRGVSLSQGEYRAICNAKTKDEEGNMMEKAFLGSFKDEVHAAYAYNIYVQKIFPGANLNTDDQGAPLAKPDGFVEYVKAVPKHLTEEKWVTTTLWKTKTNPFKVRFGGKDGGMYPTLAKAAEVARQCVAKQEKARVDAIMKLDITRNNDGVAFHYTTNKEYQILVVGSALAQSFAIRLPLCLSESQQFFGIRIWLLRTTMKPTISESR